MSLPARLLAAAAACAAYADPRLEPLYDDAVRDTIERFEATGAPVTTDGEQRKFRNFWDYSVHGLTNTAPDGFKIPPFAKIRSRVEGTALAARQLELG